MDNNGTSEASQNNIDYSASDLYDWIESHNISKSQSKENLLDFANKHFSKKVCVDKANKCNFIKPYSYLKLLGKNPTTNEKYTEKERENKHTQYDNMCSLSNTEIQQCCDKNDTKFDNFYSLSKNLLFEYIKYFKHKNRIRIINIDSVYGPFDLNFNRLMPALIKNILQNKKKNSINLKQNKCMIYAGDIIKIIGSLIVILPMILVKVLQHSYSLHAISDMIFFPGLSYISFRLLSLYLDSNRNDSPINFIAFFNFFSNTFYNYTCCIRRSFFRTTKTTITSTRPCKCVTV